MNYRVICLFLTLLLALAVVAGASTLSDLSKDMAAIAKQASPASVQIDVERDMPTDGSGIYYSPTDPGAKSGRTFLTWATKSVGSGFVIDANGYILTSADVVSNAKSFKVRFSDGTSVPGAMVGSDSVLDCALIKVEKKGLKALALGDSDALQPGMLVLTVNSQAGMSNSVSLGVVAATERDTQSAAGPVLQISGTIGPGASGGAVLDTEGRVVGITFAMFSPTSRVAPFNMPKIFISPSGSSKGSSGVTPLPEGAFKVMEGVFGDLGIPTDSAQVAEAAKAASDMAANMVDVARTSGSSGFAIPINRIKPVIEQLKSGKTVEHAMLGMSLTQTPDGISLKPSTGSPADKAGVKEGDILVSANGREFLSAAALTGYITSLKPGDKVVLVVRREGKEISVTVTAGTRPVGGLAAVTGPVLARADAAAQMAQCASNIRQLVTAARLYSEHNGGKLPTSTNWRTLIKPYIKTQDVLKCPSGKVVYAFNKNLSGLSVAKITEEAATVLFFEAKQDLPNATGGRADAVLPHGGLGWFAYADGHVERASEVPGESYWVVKQAVSKPARKTLPVPNATIKLNFPLDLENADIDAVAKALSEASGVDVIVANPEVIKGKLTIHLRSTTLDAALPLICDSFNCQFTKSGSSYVIKPK